MSRKLFSIVIAVVFAFSSITMVYADANQENNAQSQELEELVGKDLSKKEAREITQDLESLQSVGLDDEISSADIEKDGDVTYTVQVNENVSSEIEVNNSGDDLTLDITEGDIHNVVEVTDDNKVFVDGEEVIVEKAEESNDLVIGSDRNNWTTTKCPYGSSSSYTKYAGMTGDSDIKVTKLLKDLAVTTIATIVALFSPIAGFAIAVAATLKSAGANSKHLSYKKYRYYHKNGNRVRGTLYVTQNRIDWYAKASFKGSKVRKVTYSCVEYY
jgi:hypothetical protein